MNIQQLRAQIAALQDATMDENKHFRSAYDEGKFDALTAVDNLLDSIQEEPVSEDLESEIQRYYVDWDEHPEYVQTARHFAKWQKQQDQETIELAEDHAMLAGMEKMREKMITAAIEWIRRNANIYNFRWVLVFREAMNKVK